MSSSEKVCCHLLPLRTVLLKISLTCRIRDTLSKNSFFTPSLYLRRSLPLDHKGHPLEGGVRKKMVTPPINKSKVHLDCSGFDFRQHFRGISEMFPSHIRSKSCRSSRSSLCKRTIREITGGEAVI